MKLLLPRTGFEQVRVVEAPFSSTGPALLLGYLHTAPEQEQRDCSSRSSPSTAEDTPEPGRTCVGSKTCRQRAMGAEPRVLPPASPLSNRVLQGHSLSNGQEGDVVS